MGRRRYAQKLQGVRHEDELGILMRAVMLKRTRDEVLAKLAVRQRQRVVIIASDDKARQAILSAPSHSHGHGHGSGSWSWSWS